MSEQLLPWLTCAGAILLAILCLPVASIARFVVEVSTWVLRLAMFGLLAVGGYYWLRPGDLPARVSDAISRSPELLALLPDRSAPHFALCAACIVVAALVPLLAVLEVTRRIAGERVREVRTLAAAPVAEAVPEPAPEPVSVGVPVMRPIDRRTAAGTITSLWSRGPARTH
ncbi:MAG TPA: hypothetical protein VKD90_09600 [Gemmataceae bacterium]|nr:hypothetical protein [Gemmataceae bacterium]